MLESTGADVLFKADGDCFKGCIIEGPFSTWRDLLLPSLLGVYVTLLVNREASATEPFVKFECALRPHM